MASRAWAATVLRSRLVAAARTSAPHRRHRAFSSAVGTDGDGGATAGATTTASRPAVNAEVSRFVRPDQTDLRVLEDGRVLWHGMDLNNLAKVYGTPLKLTYAPAVSRNIEICRDVFEAARARHGYRGDYRYCYCTKSNHFRHVVEEAVQSGAGLEFSSAWDLTTLLRALHGSGLLQAGATAAEMPLLCNGHKPADYIAAIVSARASGFRNVLPILDSADELFEYLDRPALFAPVGEGAGLGDATSGGDGSAVTGETDVLRLGIRLQMNSTKPGARSSRFGLPLGEALALCRDEIAPRAGLLELTMLHAFPRCKVGDTPDFWTAVDEAMDAYIAVKAVCPTLHSLNLGGGMPCINSFSAVTTSGTSGAGGDAGHPATHARVLDRLVARVLQRARAAGVDEPHLYTEFGSYAVANSSINIFEVTSVKGALSTGSTATAVTAATAAGESQLQQQQQQQQCGSAGEGQQASPPWYIIDSSFVTALPDTWAQSARFDLLPLNHLDREFGPAVLGGLTCDEDDYYSEEQHGRALRLPHVAPLAEQRGRNNGAGQRDEPLRVAFFNTGAYQDNLAGVGGVHHCMMEAPQQLLARVVERDVVAGGHAAVSVRVLAAVELGNELVHVPLVAPEAAQQQQPEQQQPRGGTEADACRAAAGGATNTVTVEVSSFTVHDAEVRSAVLGYSKRKPCTRARQLPELVAAAGAAAAATASDAAPAAAAAEVADEVRHAATEEPASARQP